jgi:hypothetical protein
MQNRFYSKLINGNYFKKIDNILFSKWRQNQVIKRGKNIVSKLSFNSEYKVLNGVFKDLQYPSLDITESALVPKIVGSYEYQLQPWMSRIINTNYSDIIDVGSAEGYYAVGLAKRMPNTVIHCFDINEKDIEFSKQMARVNNVSNLTWNTFCDENTLLNFPYKGKTLILCDCEGYELKLFTEKVVDKCKDVDFLIELHDVYNPAISSRILCIFQFTHTLKIVNNRDVDYCMLNGLENLSPKERAFALCEHRGGLYQNIFMEWVFLTSKEQL